MTHTCKCMRVVASTSRCARPSSNDFTFYSRDSPPQQQPVPAAGLPAAGLPAAGLSSAEPPAAGLPAAGLPAAGLPAPAGRPVPARGLSSGMQNELVIEYDTLLSALSDGKKTWPRLIATTLLSPFALTECRLSIQRSATFLRVHTARKCLTHLSCARWPGQQDSPKRVWSRHPRMLAEEDDLHMRLSWRSDFVVCRRLCRQCFAFLFSKCGLTAFCPRVAAAATCNVFSAFIYLGLP